MPVKKLLIISNGHGEDLVAAEIVRRLPKGIEVSGYPVVGEGRAFEGVCPVVGPRRSAGREANRPRRSLIRDILAGLGIGPSLRFMRNDAKDYDTILVVGDTLGVVMCWFGRRRVRVYLDVHNSGYETAYTRSEMFIMRRTADLVLTRDEILARQLTGEKVNARFAGNALMDTIDRGSFEPQWHRRNLRAIAILPGIRPTLAANFAIQMEALRRVPGIEGIDVFAVLARAGDAQELVDASGMRFTPSSQRPGDLGTLRDGRVTVNLSTHSLGAVLAASDLVLAQAGTAVLQAIGLGKPVISFHAQGSATPADPISGEARIFTPRDPAAMATVVARLLADHEERAHRGAVGRERIGPPGAIEAIIAELAR